MNKRSALLILDGWGIGNKSNSDAVYSANTQYFDYLLNNNINSTLRTDGLHVGLPEGQMGNSEVGHLNIGSGRVVFQELVKINKSINSGEFLNKDSFKEISKLINVNPSIRIHIMGLVSDGGIHSHLDHLKATINAVSNQKTDIFIHAFTDGRDTSPNGGVNYIKDLVSYTDQFDNCELSSVIGRYYAMDRDNRWERVAKAYNLLVKGEGEKTDSVLDSLSDFYKNNITDEFIPAVKVNTKSKDGFIKEDDIVICFNYRTDRCREISIALTQKDLPDYDMEKININYFTMTNYDEKFEGITNIFPKQNLKNTLGEVLESNNRSQLRIAETEKYPHVTFFFSGGREKEFEGETRIMVSSPKVATYDLQPSMGALEITQNTINHIKSDKASDFICLNFANPDMVGHTGVYEAVIEAVETVDKCLSDLVPKLIEEDYQIIIIADHGNAEKMKNEDQSIHTAHTTNPVPCILVNSDYSELKPGKLADIAPTILKLMDIKQPEEMDGISLV